MALGPRWLDRARRPTYLHRDRGIARLPAQTPKRGRRQPTLPYRRHWILAKRSLLHGPLGLCPIAGWRAPKMILSSLSRAVDSKHPSADIIGLPEALAGSAALFLLSARTLPAQASGR